jgi:hypothetical protein
MTTPSEEIQQRAFDKLANIKVSQLYQLAQIIDLGLKRGAFHGKEATHVGTLFDTLSLGVDKAFEMTKLELEEEEKMPALVPDNVEEVPTEVPTPTEAPVVPKVVTISE